jgi:hypothetical protein
MARRGAAVAQGDRFRQQALDRLRVSRCRLPHHGQGQHRVRFQDFGGGVGGGVVRDEQVVLRGCTVKTCRIFQSRTPTVWASLRHGMQT